MNNVEEIGRVISAHSRSGSANGRRSARRRPRKGAGGAAGPSSGAESGATAQNLTGFMGFTTTATSGPPPGVTAEQLAARQRAQSYRRRERERSQAEEEQKVPDTR